MSIFEGLKNKLVGKKESDFSDIRSQVLNEDKYMDESDTGSWKRKPMDNAADIFDPAKPVPRFGSEPFGSKFDRQPVDLPAAAPPERESYEIMDKLNFLEAQISAIRSQTELINERLKNMEARLGTRRW